MHLLAYTKFISRQLLSRTAPFVETIELDSFNGSWTLLLVDSSLFFQVRPPWFKLYISDTHVEHEISPKKREQEMAN